MNRTERKQFNSEEDTKHTRVGVEKLDIEKVKMADGQNQIIDRLSRALSDYAAPTFNANMSSILSPMVAANNLEIKLALIIMIQTAIQFRRHPNDDQHTHINNFLEICNTLKINGIGDNTIQLQLFHFSLQDIGKTWLNSFILGYNM